MTTEPCLVRIWDGAAAETELMSMPGLSSARWLPRPRQVIAVAALGRLRYGLCYRDVEKRLAERGVAVDQVTVYRRVPRLTPAFIDTATVPAPADRWSLVFR
jgi:transposase-like protein